MARVEGRRVVLGLVALACTACATTTASPIRVRESTEAEARLVRAALTPLLVELNDPAVHRNACAVALAVMPTNRINASIAPGKSTTTPCTSFTLVVTEGALRRLPEPMLRAVLAHELGHVALQHAGRKTRAYEAAADQFAAKLLKRLEPRYPDACVQLVYVFSALAEQGSLAAAWFSEHPSPDRRAETTLEGCNR
jgi:Zn-dependent protease with chaperone function